jgi:hypothetical protein
MHREFFPGQIIGHSTLAKLNQKIKDFVDRLITFTKTPDGVRANIRSIIELAFIHALLEDPTIMDQAVTLQVRLHIHAGLVTAPAFTSLNVCTSTATGHKTECCHA